MAGHLRRIVRVWLRQRAFGLAGLVVIWWLLIAGAVAHMLPPRVWSASPRSLVLEPGRYADIRQPDLPDWPLPTSREAYDEFQRGVMEGNEDVMDHAFVIAPWVKVNDGDGVRIVTVDGDLVEVELLDGKGAGHLAWLTSRRLGPP